MDTLWFSCRLHSCIMAMPLPEKTFTVLSVITAELPVLKKIPSSHAENQRVRLAEKMNRSTLFFARCVKVVSGASGVLSSASVRRIPAMNGWMVGPRAC